MTRLPVPVARAGLPAPRRQRDDYAFLPAALEILETPLSPVRTSLMLSICAVATAALVWSYVGRIDVIASAQGKVQAVGRTKTIQPLEAGKVERVAVENGQAVEAGAVLIELDTGEARADEATLRADFEARRAEVLRRRIALDAALKRAPVVPGRLDWGGVPAEVARREERVLSGDLGDLASRVAGLEAQRGEKLAERDRLRRTIEAQTQLVATLKQRVDMRVELLGKGAASKATVIDAQEAYQTQGTALASQQGQLGEAEAGMARAAREIDKAYAAFIADNAQKLAEAERQAAEDAEKLAKAKIRTRHMVLTSPVSGTVQGLSVTTPGQVVQSGEQLLQVVPQAGGIEVEAYLPNGDAGFVKAGQPAVVKVDSFPFTHYGTLDAHVVRVARDAIPEPDAEAREGDPIRGRRPEGFGGAQRVQNLVFPVTLKLDTPVMRIEGAEVPLSPGMAVTVEVKTGTRRILSYVLAPLTETLSTAAKER